MVVNGGSDLNLRVEGLSFGYGALPVLDNLTLPALRPGEVTAVVGPNAAGTSTLLKCIAGLLPAQGQIWLNDQVVRTREQQRTLRHSVTYLP